MTTGPTDVKVTTAAGGPDGMPLALRLNEGLGITGGCTMDDEDKARELTTRLFFVPPTQADSWPFEVPNFTMDAQSCRKVVAAIAVGDEKLRIVFDRKVKEYLAEIGWVESWSMSLMILTPLVLVDIALNSLGEVGR